MKCPRDGTELARVQVGTVELDKCHACDGIWFDRGELERLRDSQQTEIEQQLEATYGNPEVTRGATEGYMRCPRCAGRLQEIRYTYTRAVRIDRCESCLGFWLDAGELNAITGERKTLEAAVSEGRLTSALRAAVRWWDRNK